MTKRLIFKHISCFLFYYVIQNFWQFLSTVSSFPRIMTTYTCNANFVKTPHASNSILLKSYSIADKKIFTSFVKKIRAEG